MNHKESSLSQSQDWNETEITKAVERLKKEQGIACGACGAAAPDLFDYDDEGVAECILKGDLNRGVSEVPEALYDDLDEACSGCPTASIKVSTAPFE